MTETSIRTDEPTYLELTKKPVSYSIELDESAIADYDENGRVVGIEFLDEKAASDREKYLALANRATQGKQKVPKPPSD